MNISNLQSPKLEFLQCGKLRTRWSAVRIRPGAPSNCGSVNTPPQEPDVIIALMRDLERFINDEEIFDADPLIKMALIHHQFESIHPFYVGNGRTGRIINVLYLANQGLLDIPVLYLSRHACAALFSALHVPGLYALVALKKRIAYMSEQARWQGTIGNR